MGKMIKGLRLLGKYFVMYLSMLMPRDKKLCVFGAWLGERFADNSMQLFLEGQEREGLRCVWIAKAPGIIQEIREMGYEAYLWGSPQAVWVQLRAKYAVVSNGISDLQHTFLGRAVILDLWHGVPLKKICYDDKYEKDWDSLRQKIRDFFINIPLGREYYVATSQNYIPIYQSAFRKPAEKILCLGQPRNDVFFQERPAPYFAGKRIILYCPTHRKEGEEPMYAGTLFDLERLEAFLEKEDYYFVIKKHFYHRKEQEDLSAYPRILDITSENIDVQRLILEVSLLITDYSSIYIDYLLLDAPLLFYCYDYREYLEHDREMYFDYHQVTPGNKAEDFDGLLAQLEQAVHQGREYGRQERCRLRDFFYCKEGQKPVGNILLDWIQGGRLPGGADKGK